MPDADLESLRSGRIAHETAVHVNSGIFFEGVSKRGLRDHSVRRFPNIAALIEKHNHQLPPGRNAGLSHARSYAAFRSARIFTGAELLPRRRGTRYLGRSPMLIGQGTFKL